ncbi:hypothetical protein [Streptomyces sp. NPDC058252]|uniref:hypothetical protein n=1 Tax=Streptomyces sp. NPDC058252 TaxID=3346405 RepID=UPI0036F13BCE
MRTARDNHVWKVRVLLQDYWGAWVAKTFFYSREFNVDRWRKRAESNDKIKIDFIGKYDLEEDSGE